MVQGTLPRIAPCVARDHCPIGPAAHVARGVPGYHPLGYANYLSLVPIATLLLGYSLFVWQGEVFEWVGWGNVLGAFGLLGSLKDLDMQDADLGALLMKVLSIAIGAIALYLARKVFQKPEVVKDPFGQAPPRYVFPVEGV
jgi:hypothetical protein